MATLARSVESLARVVPASRIHEHTLLATQRERRALAEIVLFRESLYAAYRIAKAHAQTDRKVMDVLAPVVDFMRKNVAAAAAARRTRTPAPAGLPSSGDA
ncbi:hypothetical protein [Sorangium atrum]|uniref:Uncharacterized protein n=1 Tax=Sorangium atrum TaxID=2995308 RepID=A0ABT5C641_9BACT|nr:hypothetical protein [Sorangium aterium]MDC0680631.1 hypothetical protein [Sorangium aterium]